VTLVVSYFTIGTTYEREAELLGGSLDRLGIRSKIVGIEDRGSWDANVAAKPLFLREVRKTVLGPILYVDVDAFFHENPIPYFDGLADRKIDFAAHWFAGPGKGHDFSKNCSCLRTGRCNREHRLLSGTLFFGDTKAARDLIDVWIAFNRACASAGWKTGGGQKNLWAVVRSRARDLRSVELPGRYCYVFDKPKAYPDGEPIVIEHTIASRDNRAPPVGRKKKKDKARAARIRELESLV
jgi:hypothetical protein